MNTIFFNSGMSDCQRRKNLYEGQVFVFSPTAASITFCEFAHELISEAFAPYDPLRAQFHIPVERYVEILAELKPRFIHHPRSKEFIQLILREHGCDPETTYFDVPRLRTATSDDYLTAGIAYAFHPHRDTWYSAALCQLNWWFPVYEVQSENVMAFHPRYWNQGVRNGSRRYNYSEWNKDSRKNAAKHIKTDTRDQPRPEEPMELDPQVRVVSKIGGIMIFSAAQMHSTVPNTSGYTRFSIDFRTVNVEDVTNMRGAVNVDSACTGTALRDFLRVSDRSRLPETLVAPYDGGPAPAELISPSSY